MKNIQVHLEPVQELPTVSGDRDKLFQILENLIQNAIKYTDPKGTITVTLTCLDHRQVKVCIADTGCGIPQQELPNIFKPFYRVATTPKPKSGVGLGLALTHELVTLHQGTLWVESSPGHGSRFYVSFPTSTSTPVAAGVL